MHANYWLSGVVAHRIKHELDIPFVSTFHTLARVKAEGGDPEPGWRERAEAEMIGCADAICVSCIEEEQQFRRLYGDPARPDRDRRPRGRARLLRARRAVGGARRDRPADRRPVLLFVGRIQPLKGPDVAVRALGELDRARRPPADRGRGQRRRGRQRGGAGRTSSSTSSGSIDRVRFVPPQPHHLLSTYYRAADVVIVPSRSESFGLVALEAAACGIPVVASAVGGLQSLVDDGDTGFLVRGRDPAVFAAAIAQILDDPLLAASMSVGGGPHGQALHVELRRRPPAPPLHRPDRPAAGRLRMTGRLA